MAKTYVGRFAPSPSGPLHFGSLIAAVGSFLESKSQGGLWLVRMEDIDPPREMPGAKKLILSTLEAFGLHWDGAVLYQSAREARYRECLEYLRGKGLVYACDCTRAQIRQAGGRYSGKCRERKLAFDSHHAIRLRNTLEISTFRDRVQGLMTWETANFEHDFMLKRRDGLWAYQFAVVIDDMDQGITDVVRGADLAESTPRQIALHRLLGNTPPSWAHLPLASFPDGRKLSKQNHAPPLNTDDPQGEIIKALRFLGQDASEQWRQDTPEQLLQYAARHWRLDQVPKQRQICGGTLG